MKDFNFLVINQNFYRLSVQQFKTLLALITFHLPKDKHKISGIEGTLASISYQNKGTGWKSGNEWNLERILTCHREEEF